MEGRTGFIRRGYQKVWVGDDLKFGTPESIDTMIAARQLEKQLQMLENEERLAIAREYQMKMAANRGQVRNQNAPQSGHIMSDPRDPISPIVPYSHRSISSSLNGYDAASIEARKLAILNAKSQQIGTIPSNAKVEAIGVYETKNRSAAGVTVIIKRSIKPIVLMLSAYEPVRWNLIREPGANLVAVIASGYNIPEVTGANGIKTLVRKGSYAYEARGDSYAALNADAIMWTGKPIGNFQGAYGGTVFVVQ